jgi:hypothetical protein
MKVAPGAPAFPLLSVEDIAADLRIQQDQVAIYRKGCGDLCGANAALEVGEKLCVAVGREGFQRRLNLVSSGQT